MNRISSNIFSSLIGFFLFTAVYPTFATADNLLIKGSGVANEHKISSPAINIESISIVSIDLSALNLALILSVENTSVQDMTVTSVIYEVHSMSTTIAGRIDQLEEFKAKEQRIVKVPVSLQHSSSSLILLDVLRSESRAIPYKILGKAKLKGKEDMIPFVHHGEYTI